MFYIYRSVINFKLIFIFGIRYELRFLVLFIIFASVQFNRSVVYDSLQPHEPQHARPPCPWPTLRVHPNPHVQFWPHLLQRLSTFQLIAFTLLSEMNDLTCVGLFFVLSILLHWFMCLSSCQHNPILTVWLRLEIMWCKLSYFMSF